jgi:hypothetical protein
MSYLFLKKEKECRAKMENSNEIQGENTKTKSMKNDV